VAIHAGGPVVAGVPAVLLEGESVRDEERVWIPGVRAYLVERDARVLSAGGRCHTVFTCADPHARRKVMLRDVPIGARDGDRGPAGARVVGGIVAPEVGIAVTIEVVGAERGAAFVAPPGEPFAVIEAGARRRSDPGVASVCAVVGVVAPEIGLAVSIEVAGAEGGAGMIAPASEPQASIGEAAARRERDPGVASAGAVGGVVAPEVGLAVTIEVAGAKGGAAVMAPAGEPQASVGEVAARRGSNPGVAGVRAVDGVVAPEVDLAVTIEVAGAKGGAIVIAPASEPQASIGEAATRRERDPGVASAGAVGGVVAPEVGLAVTIEVAGAKGGAVVAAPAREPQVSIDEAAAGRESDPGISSMRAVVGVVAPDVGLTVTIEVGGAERGAAVIAPA